MSSPIEVYCDFDGTITRGDTIDVLLERLAHPSWKEVEARWERGEIGSRECMAQQVPLLQGGWAAVEKVLDDGDSLSNLNRRHGLSSRRDAMERGPWFCRASRRRRQGA